MKYLGISELYEGYWENTKEKCRLNRIFVLFDEEDPRIFMRRFKQAYTNRQYAESLMKYNYYIENMPTHQIPEIDNEEINRILGLTHLRDIIKIHYFDEIGIMVSPWSSTEDLSISNVSFFAIRKACC